MHRGGRPRTGDVDGASRSGRGGRHVGGAARPTPDDVLRVLRVDDDEVESRRGASGTTGTNCDTSTDQPRGRASSQRQPLYPTSICMHTLVISICAHVYRVHELGLKLA